MENDEILREAFWTLHKANNLLMDETIHEKLDADWVDVVNRTVETWQFFYKRYKLHQQATSK